MTNNKNTATETPSWEQLTNQVTILLYTLNNIGEDEVANDRLINGAVTATQHVSDYFSDGIPENEIREQLASLNLVFVRKKHFHGIRLIKAYLNMYEQIILSKNIDK